MMSRVQKGLIAGVAATVAVSLLEIPNMFLNWFDPFQGVIASMIGNPLAAPQPAPLAESAPRQFVPELREAAIVVVGEDDDARANTPGAASVFVHARPHVEALGCDVDW